MNYFEYHIACATPDDSDILVAELSEFGFDSFSDFLTDEMSGAPGSIRCYIPENEEETHRQAILAFLKEYGQPYERWQIVPENWNAAWESNFDPISVGGGRCYIHAPFHDEPDTEPEHRIVIMPKMSFGTGHHATTTLMVEQMLEMDFAGTTVLDMGSGTGILAILAAQRGAVLVDAVDIDTWAYENCLENIQANEVAGTVCTILGDASALGKNIYDVILANINRNILLEDMETYVRYLRTGGSLLISGFLTLDVECLRAHAEKLGLDFSGQRGKDGWAQLTFKK